LDIGIPESVAFQGRVENPRDYLAASDVFVLPSKAEGMSNSLLEAMASGLPVIASSVAGNTDVITHSQNGLLFNVGSYTELSTAIIRILKDDHLSSRLSSAARQTAVEKYSFEQVVQRHQMLYREVLRKMSTHA
jgi:glycosyltransferase involved in cell wall biosynthesis